MNKVRAWLLIKLAAGDSVVLNSVLNIHKDGAEPEYITITYGGKTYQAMERCRPVLEVASGALIANNRIQEVGGRRGPRVGGQG